MSLETGFSLIIETPTFISDLQTVAVVAPENNPEPVVVTITGEETVIEQSEQSAHSDGDSIPDNLNECPLSDLSGTVVIDSCDSGVANTLFSNGCTISDDVTSCADAASNQGRFMSGVA